MQSLKTILLCSALVALTPNADAASANRSCFEMEAEAQQFVVDLKAYETSYHDAENKRRKIFEETSQSYKSLRYILGEAPNLSFVDSEVDKTQTQTHLTQYTPHKHLIPGEVRPDDLGQYCSIIHSEIHIFTDVWNIDLTKNLVLSSKTYTDISR